VMVCPTIKSILFTLLRIQPLAFDPESEKFAGSVPVTALIIGSVIKDLGSPGGSTFGSGSLIQTSYASVVTVPVFRMVMVYITESPGRPILPPPIVALFVTVGVGSMIVTLGANRAVVNAEFPV